MQRRKAKGFLSKIRLRGAAAVDFPAHEHEGWLVCKSVDKTATDEDWMQSIADAWLAGNDVRLQ